MGSEVYEKSSLSIGDNDINKFKISNDDVYGGEAYLDLTMNGFSSESNTEVVIKAEGYMDMTFTVDRYGKIQNGEAEEEEPPMLPAEAPTLSKNFGWDYKFNFATDEAKNWLKAVTAVTVNDQTYSRVDSAYSVYGDEDYYVDTDYILIGEGGFTDEGNTVVIISAQGYADMLYTIDQNGQLVNGNLPVTTLFNLENEFNKGEEKTIIDEPAEEANSTTNEAEAGEEESVSDKETADAEEPDNDADEMDTEDETENEEVVDQPAELLEAI